MLFVWITAINMYMPYEGNEDMTDEFAEQFTLVESLINDNLDCHVVDRGDFNVVVIKSVAYLYSLQLL